MVKADEGEPAVSVSGQTDVGTAVSAQVLSRVGFIPTVLQTQCTYTLLHVSLALNYAGTTGYCQAIFLHYMLLTYAYATLDKYF